MAGGPNDGWDTDGRAGWRAVDGGSEIWGCEEKGEEPGRNSVTLSAQARGVDFGFIMVML